jgi:hypothetical protein
MNTSATGGYLAPKHPSDDAQLMTLLQSVIQGITGLEDVQFKTQHPDSTGNLCTFGVLRQCAGSPAIVHRGEDDGEDVYKTHERITVMCSFLGPDCREYASLLRDGLAIVQNQHALKAQGLSFMKCSNIKLAQHYQETPWQAHYDMFVDFSREVTRVYPILNLLSAPTAVNRYI